VTVYGVLAILSVAFPKQYRDCERDTKYLNGGEKVYAGRKLKIVLCGDGGWRDDSSMHDEIRMQIFSENGSLLAQRRFIVDWPDNGLRELSYGGDHLIYIDRSRPNDYKRKVSMPPTKLDWIRARLPLVD
jgi:hypothetical protein